MGPITQSKCDGCMNRIKLKKSLFPDSMQIVAKRLLIFGMHVNIGIKGRDLRIDIMNQMRYFRPHILTLSTWGQKTGFKSSCSIVFEYLPRTGIQVTLTSRLIL